MTGEKFRQQLEQLAHLARIATEDRRQSLALMFLRNLARYREGA